MKNIALYIQKSFVLLPRSFENCFCMRYQDCSLGTLSSSLLYWYLLLGAISFLTSTLESLRNFVLPHALNVITMARRGTMSLFSPIPHSVLKCLDRFIGRCIFKPILHPNASRPGTIAWQFTDTHLGGRFFVSLHALGSKPPGSRLLEFPPVALP